MHGMGNRIVAALTVAALGAVCASSAVAGSGDGVASVEVKNRRVFITGDAGDNWVMVDQPDIPNNAGVVDVWGNGTIINMGAGCSPSPDDMNVARCIGATRDYIIEMELGNNILMMNDVPIGRRLKITLGPGDDSVMLADVDTAKNLKLELGAGNNEVEILAGVDDTNFTTNSKIKGDDGIDIITITGDNLDTNPVNFRGSIITKDGDDVITIGNVGTNNQGNIIIQAGNGNDTLTIDTVQIGNKMLANGGRDMDTFTIGSINVVNKSLIKGSADVDSLTDNGSHTGSVLIRSIP